MVYNIRGKKNDNCPGKVKFIKETGEVQIYEKYIKCNSYIECIYNFVNKFKNISLNFTENNVNKLKLKICWGIKNSTIEEIDYSIKLNNKNMIVDVVSVKSEFLNENREIEKREQNIIITGDKDIINYLNKEKGKQVGLDSIFKNIPILDEKEKNVILSCVLCIKYTDSESLKKAFAILNINYNLYPISVTIDFNPSQIMFKPY